MRMSKWFLFSLRGKDHSFAEFLLYLAYVTTRRMQSQLTGQGKVPWAETPCRANGFLPFSIAGIAVSVQGCRAGLCGEGELRAALGEVGSYTLDPSLPGSLENHRASKEGLLVSQPPKHGSDLHRDYASWSQNPFLRFSADGEEVFVVGRLFGPVSASVILDIFPHLPSPGSWCASFFFFSFYDIFSSCLFPLWLKVFLSLFSVFFWSETTLRLSVVAFNLEVLWLQAPWGQVSTSVCSLQCTWHLA